MSKKIRKYNVGDFEKPTGARYSHRTLESRMKRFERIPGSYQFIPALMHTLERMISGKSPETLTEVRLSKVLAELGKDVAPIEKACQKWASFNPDLKTRIFSSRYTPYTTARPISDIELAAVVSHLPTAVGSARAFLNVSGKGSCCCPEGGNQNEPALPRDEYSVVFKKLYCVDESNPERPFVSDEPYCTFSVLTEAQAESGNAGYSVQTETFEEVDDGDTRRGNLSIWGKVAPKPIDSPFLLASLVMEHDNGSQSEASSGLRSSLSTVATTAAGVGGPAGWIVAGAAAIGVGITFLVDLWASDDQIGEIQTLSFTESKAHSLTSAENPIMLPPLHHDGGDGDGIYDVYLQLERNE